MLIRAQMCLFYVPSLFHFLVLIMYEYLRGEFFNSKTQLVVWCLRVEGFISSYFHTSTQRIASKVVTTLRLIMKKRLKDKRWKLNGEICEVELSEKLEWNRIEFYLGWKIFLWDNYSKDKLWFRNFWCSCEMKVLKYFLF